MQRKTSVHYLTHQVSTVDALAGRQYPRLWNGRRTRWAVVADTCIYIAGPSPEPGRQLHKTLLFRSLSLPSHTPLPLPLSEPHPRDPGVMCLEQRK